jgi:hypothetical protein
LTENIPVDPDERKWQEIQGLGMYSQPEKPGIKKMVAKYNGFCRICNKPIVAGTDIIVHDKERGWVHSACYAWLESTRAKK